MKAACLCKHGTINVLNKQKPNCSTIDNFVNTSFSMRHPATGSVADIKSPPVKFHWIVDERFTYPNGNRKQNDFMRIFGGACGHTSTAQINQFVTYLHLIIAWIRSTKVQCSFTFKCLSICDCSQFSMKNKNWNCQWKWQKQ